MLGSTTKVFDSHGSDVNCSSSFVQHITHLNTHAIKVNTKIYVQSEQFHSSALDVREWKPTHLM